METQETILETDLLLRYNKDIPHIIKYMGSKRSLLDFVIKAIDDTYQGGYICDMFAGTSILSGALGKLVPMHSNDIQEYSSVLAHTYLSNIDWNKYPNIINEITEKAITVVSQFKNKYPELNFDYRPALTIQQFVEVEESQQALIHFDFGKQPYHLFTKYYSGTYWSFEQCLWIDSLRKVADDYKNTPVFYIILSSLMHAMSYNSQSTGHYAQYRDATNNSSKEDILTYRQRAILPYFVKKFNQLISQLGTNELNHLITTLDYNECLNVIRPGTLVYADPPYAFVHYSRFYHAIETLVKYDYPKVSHKGRYRVDRHQSPFCQRTMVKQAFSNLFEGVKRKNSSLILSYSNTGMIMLDEITAKARSIFGKKYSISVRENDYLHSTMGRNDDRRKEVKEYLIICS